MYICRLTLTSVLFVRIASPFVSLAAEPTRDRVVAGTQDGRVRILLFFVLFLCLLYRRGSYTICFLTCLLLFLLGVFVAQLFIFDVAVPGVAVTFIQSTSTVVFRVCCLCF